MIWIEALGYIAAVCTLATYSMKTMIPLRISGIIANCFFIAFGFFGAIYPTLILHVILLPLMRCGSTRCCSLFAGCARPPRATCRWIG